MNIFKVNGKRINIGDLIISFLITLGGSFLISLFTSNSKILYLTYKKPPFAPPGWVFGIVWPILYILMAIAATRIYTYKKEGANISNALVLYGIQLAINFIWPIVFFKFSLYGLSFILLIILLVFVIITTIKFYKIDKLSGILMVPYILWLLFAGVLNFYIWFLNEM